MPGRKKNNVHSSMRLLHTYLFQDYSLLGKKDEMEGEGGRVYLQGTLKVANALGAID